MEIDLNDIPLGISESLQELTILKSGKIYKEVFKISESRKYTVMTVSMPVYNVLIYHNKFDQISIDNLNSLTQVGFFCGYKVFLDLSLHENIIKLGYDPQEKRNNVLDNLLNNKVIKKDLKIKVLNC